MVSMNGVITDERKKRIWFLWKQGHSMVFIESAKAARLKTNCLGNTWVGSVY